MLDVPRWEHRGEGQDGVGVPALDLNGRPLQLAALMNGHPKAVAEGPQGALHSEVRVILHLGIQ